MREYFNQQFLVEYVDYALLTKELLQLNKHYKDKAICIEEPPINVVPKLYSSSVIVIHPDIFDKWTDILIELTQRKPLNNIKLFIIHGSDYFIDGSIIEVMLALFPNATFWIQNYVGLLNDQCKLLPIGVNDDFTEEVVKQKLFSISFVTYNSFYRQEFYQFLKDNDEFTKKYYTVKTDMPTYFKNLSQLYFTACPMGNGFDTLRFWESLMLKTIPIVRKHTFYEALRDYYPKLPFIEIESWDELPALVESLTFEKYETMIKDFDIECLKESYWIDQIKSKYIIE